MKIFLRVFFLALVCALTMAFLKGAEDPSTNWPSAKKPAALAIQITSPTANSGFATHTSPISLTGQLYILSTKIKNPSKIKIAWAIKVGKKTIKGKGSVIGNTGWSVSNIPLQVGDNRIVVTAKGGGTKATASVVATFNPNLDFLSAAQALPHDLFVNEPSNILFRIAIENNSNLVNTSVKVLRLDSSGAIVGEVCNLADDGNVDNGDDILNDGVYSGVAILMESQPGLVFMRIAADTSDAGGTKTAYSEVFSLSTLLHLSDSEFADAKAMPGIAQNKYDELLSSYKNNENKARKSTITWLKKQSGVSEAGEAESGKGIWFLTKSGLLGGILLNPEGTEATRPTYEIKRPRTDKKLIYKSEQKHQRSADTITVGNKKALVIAPFNWQWASWGTAFENNIYQMLDNMNCPDYQVDQVYDDNATVNFFKLLDLYGVIVLHTHGDAFFNLNLRTISQSLDDIFALAFGKVVFLTGEKVTDASKAAYEADLKTGRLAIIGDYYAITPAFITYYAPAFPESFIYNGSCRGIYNQSMAMAFLGSGAKTYYGFSNYVLSTYDRDCALTLFDSLVNQGKTTKESFVDAIAARGPSDGQGAYFLMEGAENLTLTGEGISNGGFEDANINGWSGQGDVRVIPQLGPLSPQEGSFMCIISTGLGAVNDSDSRIEQVFCIPEGATTLSFDYNVVSEEPLEFVGSIYDDQFEAALSTAGGGLLLAFESINTSAWYGPISGINFYGGDDTVYETGWKHAAFDVSGLVGQSVKLIFHTWDNGDSIYDTAALIDKIVIE